VLFDDWFLEHVDFLGLGAFRTLADDELYTLTFFEGAKAAGLDGRVVYKNVGTGFTLDEAVALRSVEPLYNALFLVGPDWELLSI